ncbi:MAG: histidinol dehydrogenase [Candidatus Lokiarchaeota archaeon]|nr:histidinol dehydrogenase [Candidatus Lokiarchaeota archaeon]
MKIVLEIHNLDEFESDYLEMIIERGKIIFEEVNDVVSDIIDKVIEQGDDALVEFTEKFDGVRIKKENLLVTREEIEEAYNSVDESFLKALRQAKKNIKKFHEAQIKNKWFIETEPGVQVGQIVRPFKRAGLYIPGGRAPYPSTVLMTAIPARAAGVGEIFLVTPPNKDGKIDPSILVAADECKVTEIYKVGGAQAIAALAYGTLTIKPVDKIIGPGNMYVMAAKILVSNDVRIDLPAGPSEICIISDSYADPRYITVDIMAQAEHDPDTFCILLTTSKGIAMAVASEIEVTYQDYDRKDIIREALENNVFLVVVENLSEAIRISNLIAPEHLEILVKEEKEEAVLSEIQNAGAIFLGKYSPVAIGDYSAGSNHVLPTGGTAKNYSGLSTMDFMKVIDVVNCTKEGLQNLKDSVLTLAKREGLDVHAQSVLKRLEN